MAPLGSLLVGYLSLFLQLGVLSLLAGLSMLVRISLGRRTADAWTIGLLANAAALAVLGASAVGHAAGVVPNPAGATLVYVLLEDAGALAFIAASRLERGAKALTWWYGAACALAFGVSASAVLAQSVFFDAYKTHAALLAILLTFAAVESLRARGGGLGAKMLTVSLLLLAVDYAHVTVLTLFGVRFEQAYLGLESYATMVLDIALGVAIVVRATDAARSELERRNVALAEAERALREAAYTDALCGVPNRAAFLAHLETAPPSGVVAMIDLDGLKLINDRFGHATGDAALAKAAHVLRHRCSGAGTVFRIGGDEFAVIWEGIEAPEVRAVLVEVERDLALVIERPTRIRISWGIATFDPGTPIGDALLAADAALYGRRNVRRA